MQRHNTTFDKHLYMRACEHTGRQSMCDMNIFLGICTLLAYRSNLILLILRSKIGK